MHNSRLQRYYDKRSQRQVVVFGIGSIIFLILIVVYGFPLLLGLTSTIGNLRHSQTASSSAVTTVAPTIPTLNQNYQATFSANIKITGVADAKTNIELFQNGQSQGTVLTQDDGTFSMDVALQSGSNIFTATAINDAGQRSAASETYTITYIVKKPNLDVSAPKDGDTTNASPYTVSGQTDPGDTITINDRLAIVGNDGKFSYNMVLNDGDNKLHIVATDPAGNQTAKDLTLKYQK